ncbi:MAG: hypothetical protein F6K39_37555 [Okeania sp. SIO3B3]|nr:hypothetical protein [Okeania sp. SIO3B3]
MLEIEELDGLRRFEQRLISCPVEKKKEKVFRSLIIAVLIKYKSFYR